MIQLKRRTPVVEADHFIYPSTTRAFAEKYDGLVDKVTGDLYIQTSTGVKVMPYNSWIVCEGETVSIMTDEQMMEAFEPVDADEAYNYLGGRRWPAQMKLAVA